jgi:hypothetical protein
VDWIDVTADSAVGRVNLAPVFKTTAMVCACAFAETDAADAKLFTSVDAAGQSKAVKKSEVKRRPTCTSR